MPVLKEVEALGYFQEIIGLTTNPKTVAEYVSARLMAVHTTFVYDVAINAAAVITHGDEFMNVSVVDNTIPTKVITNVYYLFSEVRAEDGTEGGK